MARGTRKTALNHGGKTIGTVESLTIDGKPLHAIPAAESPVDVDRQAAMYEAHERGDEAEFVRLRDEQ